MLEVFAQIFDAWHEVMLLTAMCSIRILAALYVLPATGSQVIQGRIRASLAVTIGLFVAFGQHHPPSLLGTHAAIWLGTALKEMLIGLAIGFAAAVVFWTAECVGAMIDTQAGYNNVQMTNPFSGEQSTPLSSLLLQVVIGVFWILGGATLFTGVLIESFVAWPLFSPLPSAAGVAELFVVQYGNTLLDGVVKFAAPVLLILVLIDLGVGLITRTASKLEPSGLSQPIKGAVAMLLLSLLIGIFLHQVRHLLLPVELLPALRRLLSS
jgi:type III secretion protein T